MHLRTGHGQTKSYTLMPRLLDRIWEEELKVLLGAPERTVLQQLLPDQPGQLPGGNMPLLQAGGAIRCFPVISQKLWVWPLNGNV